MLIWNRTLTEDERQRAEHYVNEKYAHQGSPAQHLAKRMFASSPQDFITSASKVVATGMNTAAFVSYALRLESVPRRFGIPFMMMLFDEATGVQTYTPIAGCDTRDTCRGRRYYSICYNGGNDFFHCDETRQLTPKTWYQQQVDVEYSFASKYGPSASAVSNLRITVATVASDDTVETWLDSVGVFQADSKPECSGLRTESWGSALYPQFYLQDQAAMHFRLGGAADAEPDMTGGWWRRDGVTLTMTGFGGTRSSPGLIPGDADTAVKFNLASEYAVSSTTVTKTDVNEGWSAELWMKVDTAASYTVGESDKYVSLIGDCSGSAVGAALYLGGGSKLRVVFTTSYGTSIVDTADPLDTSQAHHIVVTYSARFGVIRIYVDGELVNSNTATSSPVAMPNAGIMQRVTGAIRVGYDGFSFPIGYGMVQGAATVTIDEVAWYAFPLTVNSVWRHHEAFHDGWTSTTSAKAVVTVGSTDYAMDGGKNGLLFVVATADSHTVTDTQTFELFDAAKTDGEVTRLQNWAKTVPEGSIVLGAAKTATLPRKLMLDEPFLAPNDVPISNRVPYRDSSAGYRYVHEDGYTYPATWQGAVDFCESEGLELCSYHDYCEDAGVPSNIPAFAIWGQVEGEGWAPFLDGQGGTNKWLAVGRAYDDRVCKSYEDVFGQASPWGGSDSTTAQTHSPILCCTRPPGSPRWKEVVQRITPGGGGSTIHDDPYCTYAQSKCNSGWPAYKEDKLYRPVVAATVDLSN